MCSLSYLFLILASLGQSLSSIQESHAPKGLFSELFFAVEPKDTLASRDVPALLECLAEGSSKPIIEWKKDGNPILFLGDTRRSILTNGSLYIASVYHTRMERPDEGVYQCLATIPQVGTIVSRSAKLQVVAPPKFEEEPKDLNVVKGQTASLSCVVHAIPPASVSWLKEDVPISLEDFRVKVFQSGTLEILYVDEDDQGIYKCNASNSEKFVLSSGAMLSVYKKTDIQSPFFVTTPRNIVSVIGSNVTLECAANGNPLPTVSWLKDGTTIDTQDLDGRFLQVGAGSLQIISIEEGDVGTYQCRAENEEDSSDTQATLDIHVPPRFVRKPSNIVAYEKENVEFICEVYGRPEPTVQWLKNGDLIIESEYFQIFNGHDLRIFGLVGNDSGIYQCVASNTAGNIQTATQLKVLLPGEEKTDYGPIVHQDVTFPVGDPEAPVISLKDTPSAPRNLEAVIVSSRFVTLQWKEPAKTNGEILAYTVYYKQEDSGREITVNITKQGLEEMNVVNLIPKKKYIMRVVAINSHGAGESSDLIEIFTQAEQLGPPPPLNLRVLPQSPTTLFVTWDSPDYSGKVPLRYKLYYMEVGTVEEHEIVTKETSHYIHNLRPFTQYSVWASSLSEQGAGSTTEEVLGRTFSAPPSQVPQNVIAESASSSSIVVRWEPPPKEQQNGIIIGYKVSYKPKGRGKASTTLTTDGSSHLSTLNNLPRSAEFLIKVAAVNINGTGPYTDWITAETFDSDLDESQVPDQPSSLRAKPGTTWITVTWSPPSNQNIMVRGYTLGWGKGIPDVYRNLVDGKQRSFTIEKLEPNSEYVISLRAHNSKGEGRPIYETMRTREESVSEPSTPLTTPLGLKAVVLSSSTVVLYWTDPSLVRNRPTNDNRYYVVRYTPYFGSATNVRYRYFNSTDLNCMIDDLKPNTQYEFTVKVMKGRRESAWSLVVLNTTFEAAPSSAPRDLTVVPMEDNPTMINLNWQPPKQPNGQITGYVIFYTTDNSQRDRDWVVEAIVGDKMTTLIKGLTLDTTYFFKIQARNNKGYGPLSPVVTYRTGAAHGLSSLSLGDSRGGISNALLYIILGASGGIILILLAILLVFACKRKTGSRDESPDRSKKGYVKGTMRPENPPDLWIHHDKMEMRTLDKQRSGSQSTVDPLPRLSQDLDSIDGGISATGLRANDSLDRRGYSSAYMGDSVSDISRSSTNSGYRKARRTKPLMLPILTQLPRDCVSTPIPTAVSQPSTLEGRAFGGPSARTVSQPGGRVTTGLNDTGYNTQSSYDSRSSIVGIPASVPSVIHQTSAYSESVLGKRPPLVPAASGPQSHPLKSFALPPAPPASGFPHQHSHSAKTIASSPPTRGPSNVVFNTKKQEILNIPTRPPLGARSPNGTPVKGQLPRSYSTSTEELNQEMANLEGLMKDLNAITATDFECT
ncbi:neogenin-like isoform X1 [Artemia franciscana]|uniref:Neogenin n=1 Tax=Artemia franciscana TaxID=6661 RepID=A0AA88IQA6_ARTSF|nr:hypothetical protein QYM36_000330 [Artemia franciscana]